MDLDAHAILDDDEITRLVRSTLERMPLDSWTATRMATSLALPTDVVWRALRRLAERGLVVEVDGEFVTTTDL